MLGYWLTPTCVGSKFRSPKARQLFANYRFVGMSSSLSPSRQAKFHCTRQGKVSLSICEISLRDVA